ATTLVFSIPEAADVAETKPGSETYVTSAYATYAPVEYSVTVNGKKAEIVDGTVTVEGLAPDTDCAIVVSAKDMLGNVTELEATASTLGADALNYAYFGKEAAIKNLTAVSEAESKIAIEWTAAIPGTAEVAEPVVTYNVYVNGTLKAENLAETSYTVEGLSANTVYNIKVVTCTDGVEAGEDAIGSALEAEFSTARDPEITEVADKTTATSTVLEVSSLMDPSAFTFAIKSVLLNGEKAESSIEGNYITVEGLVAGASNTIKVVTVETQIATGTPSNVEYPLITVKTPVLEGEFNLTADDCITVGKGLPLPMCYDTLTADQWPTNASNTHGAGLWDKKEVYYTAQGSAKATIDVSETDKFYAFTQTYSYEASRYFTATVDGTPIKNKAGATFPFGKEGIVSPTDVEFNVCPQPVELTKGSHNIVLGSGNGIVRANFFAFIPDSYAYDENGALLDEAGEYESIVKYIKDNLSTKEAFLNFYIDPTLLTAESLTSAPLTETTVAVKWNPTTSALGKDITYNVYLDGKKVAAVSSKEIPQYVFEDLTPGQHTVKVDANGTYAQTITIYAAAVAAAVTADVTTVEEPLTYADGTPVTKVVGEDEVPVVGTVDVLNDITISVQNVTEESKNLTVVVATFGLNKMTKVKTETITLGYGKNSATINLEGYKTQLLAQNEEVDPNFLNTKIFVIDNDGFVPYMCEY
ncbi:MAG: fibronectin type III domain-containing protein, partial [Clostridia bacterium]|nr:fibronectin type III domain-containing protein [Clostridia bacterium]